jgi:hypothetical protein
MRSFPGGNRPTITFTRKRTIDQILYNTSSDPPLFSSDDASSSIENYERPRPKRLHHGTWWSAGKASEEGGDVLRGVKKGGGKGVKRAFNRNVDSGVWMGSDSSINSSCLSSGVDGFLVDEGFAGSDGCPASDPVFQDSEGEADSDKVPSLGLLERGTWKSIKIQRSTPKLTKKQQDAAALVQSLVDENYGNIDLMSRRLGSLPWEILRPLTTFTSDFIEDHGWKDALRLYLASNELTELPSELFGLEKLESLGVRHNKLTELSPNISKLKNLQELNVSFNSLHYLPREVLSLAFEEDGMKERRSFRPRFSPNPFFQPVYDTTSKRRNMDEPYDDSGSTDKVKLSAVAISRVAFLDARGICRSGPRPSQDLCAQQLGPGAEDHKTEEFGAKQGGARTLYELALKASMAYTVDDLTKAYGDDVPGYMSEGLKLLAGYRVHGESTCAVCGREFMIPRTEWLEWWSGFAPSSREKIPLLFRGCTWSCVPDTARLPKHTVGCGWTEIENEDEDEEY